MESFTNAAGLAILEQNKDAYRDARGRVHRKVVIRVFQQLAQRIPPSQGAAVDWSRCVSQVSHPTVMSVIDHFVQGFQPTIRSGTREARQAAVRAAICSNTAAASICGVCPGALQPQSCNSQRQTDEGQLFRGLGGAGWSHAMRFRAAGDCNGVPTRGGGYRPGLSQS